ncbi:uncharacterized protein LOC143240341 isoform X2 [Tachypleus tridentatus]|uniref:uncharacterized protein LOC143240341 isoform X2 n=1 Tax=Tachypleus tridentatus TaxID=6853 RepID=UPI003FD5720B
MGKKRELSDLGIKVFCPLNQLSVSVHDNPFGMYQLKDLVRGVVINVVSEHQKIIISLKKEALPLEMQQKIKMGLISEEEIPSHHQRMIKSHGKTYSDVLEQTLGFNNPTTVTHLCLCLGIPSWKMCSLMRGIYNKEYPREEFAVALRRQQSAKWAHRSVKDGVAHFKAGNHTEAFQCLNKALQIDTENVEALVARGAFYEEKGELEEASKTYKKAIHANMNNMNARDALLSFESKQKEKELSKTRLSSPGLRTSSHNSPNSVGGNNLSSAVDTREKLKQLLKEEKQERLKRKRKGSDSSCPSERTASPWSQSPSPHLKAGERDGETSHRHKKYMRESSISPHERSNIKDSSQKSASTCRREKFQQDFKRERDDETSHRHKKYMQEGSISPHERSDIKDSSQKSASTYRREKFQQDFENSDCKQRYHEDVDKRVKRSDLEDKYITSPMRRKHILSEERPCDISLEERLKSYYKKLVQEDTSSNRKESYHSDHNLENKHQTYNHSLSKHHHWPRKHSVSPTSGSGKLHHLNPDYSIIQKYNEETPSETQTKFESLPQK